MKRLLISCLLVVPIAAHASYELVLGLQFSGYGLYSRVSRWDGDTGTFLGYFAQNQVRSALSMVANKNNGRCYIYSADGYIFTYNYNTGAYINSFATGGFALGSISLASDGNILIADGTSLRKLNANTGATMITWTLYSGYSPQIVGQGGDGNIYAVDVSGSWLLRHGPAGGAYTAFYGQDAELTGALGHLVSQGSSGILANGLGRRLLTFNLATMTKTSSVDFSSVIGAEMNGAAYGHGTRIFVGGLHTGNVGRLVRYNSLTGDRFVFAEQPNENFVSIATVLAPEPASLVVVGAALAFLVRRRRV